MKRILIFLCLIFCYASVCGQNKVKASVSDPGSNQVSIGAVTVSNKSSDFQIKYKIKFGKNVRNCNVNLKLSNDGGKSFWITPDKQSVRGDIGKITHSGDKVIYYNVGKDKNLLIDKDVVFQVDVTNKDVMKLRTFILGQIELPMMAGGLMLGLCRTGGGYVKASTNLKKPINTSGYCLSDGRICSQQGKAMSGQYIWTNGVSNKSYLAVTGGFMVRAAKFLYPYVGAGYGRYVVTWQDTSANWFQVYDYSKTSVALDAGLIWNIKWFSIVTGVSTIGFKTFNASVGLGFSF